MITTFKAIWIATLLISLPASAVPVSLVGHSNDSWDHSPNDKLPPCEWVNDAYFTAIPKQHLQQALARLKESAAVPLGEGAAARILDQKNSSGNIALSHLYEVIHSQERKRRKVLTARKGSWSLASEQVLHRLREFVLSGEASRLRPVLMRALSQQNLFGDFIVQKCGDIVRVTNWASKESWRRPKRTAIIFFTSTIPKRVRVDWLVSEQYYGRESAP